MGKKSRGMFAVIICIFTAAIELAQQSETEVKKKVFYGVVDEWGSTGQPWCAWSINV